MALSRTEIVKRSEAKSGIKAKTFKLPLALIAEIEQLATAYNLSQGHLPLFNTPQLMFCYGVVGVIPAQPAFE